MEIFMKGKKIRINVLTAKSNWTLPIILLSQAANFPDVRACNTNAIII
jgi:hypothetical protein